MGYLRHSQIEEIENEKRVLQHTLESREVQERGNLVAHLARIDRELETKGPPDLTGDERDRLTRECQQIEERLIPQMPSDEEMRRNPPGTVGRHMRYEKLSKSRDRFPEGEIFRWKDNQLALNKGSEDPDVANFERMRPLHSHQASMLGAQIPGKVFVGTNPTPAYREGYDRTFGDEVADLSTSKPDPGDGKEELPCGKRMGNPGRKTHVKYCSVCQEAGL